MEITHFAIPVVLYHNGMSKQYMQPFATISLPDSVTGPLVLLLAILFVIGLCLDADIIKVFNGIFFI